MHASDAIYVANALHHTVSLGGRSAHDDGMVHLPTFEREQNFLRELQLPSNDAQ